MSAAVWTVLWKELKELPLQRTGFRGGILLQVLVPLGLLGVLLPWQTGRFWVDSPLMLSLAWFSPMLVANVIADSFAGERERHTLETLLASPLPDRAIVVGKILAAVGYAWGMMLVMLVLGLITVNLFHGRGQLLMYPAGTALATVLLSLLGAGLVAGLGVLVSLRASTVRQAQQTLGVAIMVLLIGPTLALQMLPPDWTIRLLSLPGRDVTRLMFGLASVLMVLDTVVLVLAMARFRRARLLGR